jgi:hypothetical protein
MLPCALGRRWKIVVPLACKTDWEGQETGNFTHRQKALEGTPFLHSLSSGSLLHSCQAAET